MAATDTILITEPTFESKAAGDIMITPTGGSATTLAQALVGGGSVASSTLGFYGTTPITQPTSASQAAVTDLSGGVAAPTTGVGATLGTRIVYVPITMAALANTQAFQVDTGFVGKLTGISYRNTVAVTTGAKAATLQVQVNGSSLTGGVVSLAGTYAVGAAQAGTAITAGTQTFTAAQTVGFLVSGVTAFTEGSGVVELTLVNTDLTNALATVVAQGNAIRSGLTALGLLKGS